MVGCETIENTNILCMPGSLFLIHQVVQQKVKILTELPLKLEIESVDLV